VQCYSGIPCTYYEAFETYSSHRDADDANCLCISNNPFWCCIEGSDTKRWKDDQFYVAEKPFGKIIELPAFAMANISFDFSNIPLDEKIDDNVEYTGMKYGRDYRIAIYTAFKYRLVPSYSTYNNYYAQQVADPSKPRLFMPATVYTGDDSYKSPTTVLYPANGYANGGDFHVAHYPKADVNFPNKNLQSKWTWVEVPVNSSDHILGQIEPQELPWNFMLAETDADRKDQTSAADLTDPVNICCFDKHTTFGLYVHSTHRAYFRIELQILYGKFALFLLLPIPIAHCSQLFGPVLNALCGFFSCCRLLRVRKGRTLQGYS
jgi:hypothetical protein